MNFRAWALFGPGLDLLKGPKWMGPFPFLAYIPYFEKIKVGLWDHIAVCVCVSAYIPIVARQRLRKKPLTFARQRLGKNSLIVVGNGSVETLPR
jgi:hypothetical protein